VQGKYIEHFEHNLGFIMGIVFQSMLYSPDIPKLVKIFTTWEALDLFRGIQQISIQHNIPQLVSICACSKMP
jgi:hypothetical protein